MKKLLLFSLLIIVSLTLFGCGASNETRTQQNNIQQSDTDAKTTENKEEQNQTRNESPSEELILNIDGPRQEHIIIDINKHIPILKSYLEQLNEAKSEIERIRSNYLFSKNQRDYFLISYSCGTKLCNQLLLQYYQGDIQTIFVSEASFFQDSTHSNDYFSLLFGRNEGTEVVRNQVVTFKLEDFQKVKPPEQLVMLESFEYPISSIEWKDNTLIVTIADIDDTSFEALMKWYKNNKNPDKKLYWEI